METSWGWRRLEVISSWPRLDPGWSSDLCSWSMSWWLRQMATIVLKVSHLFHWIFWSILSGCHCSASRLVCGGWAERVSIFPSTKWVKIWFDKLRQSLSWKVDSLNVSGCSQVSEPLSPCQSQAITSNIWGRNKTVLYSHHDLCLQYRGSSGLQ